METGFTEVLSEICIKASPYPHCRKANDNSGIWIVGLIYLQIGAHGI